MDQTDDNPVSNSLGAGVTEEALMEAVVRSGYPMQAAVVAAVSGALRAWDSTPGPSWVAVQEEWTYIDEEEGKTRALDALIESHLLVGASREPPRVRPVLSLLIECKQSELPFVFFTRESAGGSDFPVTSGFPHDEITLVTDDDPSTYRFPLTHLWDLHSRDFIVQPRTAVSVTAARRQGKSLEVSGEQTYNGLVLPLLKATSHLRRVTKYDGKHFTDGRIIVSLIVMRAPMVAIAEDGSGGPEYVPWVRIHRYEPVANARPWQSHRLAAFDIVHEDYLPTYLATLQEYVSVFASSIVANTGALLSGRGFAESLGHGYQPVQIESRSAETRAISARLGAESMWELIRGRAKPYGIYLRPSIRTERRKRETRSSHTAGQD